MQLFTNPMGSNPDSTVAKIENKSCYINPQIKETKELSTLHDKTYVFYDTWSYILLAAPGDDTVFAILLHKHKIGKNTKKTAKNYNKL